MEQDWLEFVYLPTFERAARDAGLSAPQQRELELALVNNPAVGDLIVGAGGFRKMRFAAPGTGKRGGFRVVYYFRTQRGRIYLATVYRKAVKETLTAREKAELRNLASLFDRE